MSAPAQAQGEPEMLVLPTTQDVVAYAASKRAELELSGCSTRRWHSAPRDVHTNPATLISQGKL